VFCHTMKSLAVGLVLAGAVLPGCVSSTKYKSAADQAVQAQEERDALAGQLSEAETMLVESEGQQNTLKQKAALADQLAAENAALQAKIDDLSKKGTISTPDGTLIFTDDGKYGWRAQGDIVFSPGSDKLTSKGERILSEVAAELKKNSEPITVRGHTDADPIKKTADLWPRGNMDLAANRAMSVLEYLVSQGIDSSRVYIEAYGPYKPIATGGSAEAKAKNRRVEIMTRLPASAN